MRTRSLYFLVVLTLLATLSCGKRERPLDPTLLWAPPHAKITLAPHLNRGDGACELGFTLVDVEREELTRQLLQHFEQSQFRQRSTLRKNGYPTSFGEGWQRVLGGGVIPTDAQGRILTVEDREWHGEWQNEPGEVIAYHLSEGRYNARHNSVLGYATYTRH
jgi:hypothetical protein